jgi:hypothetical protein
MTPQSLASPNNKNKRGNKNMTNQWNERLKKICQIYQIRCFDVDYCTMKEPCQNVINIRDREEKGLSTAIS